MTYLEKDVLSSIKKKDTISRNIYGKKKTDVRRETFRHAGRFWRQLEVYNFLSNVFLHGLDFSHQHNNADFLSKLTSFDPYPFILLNLMLSCVAALQAPVIMMSQNRQESRDRLRAEHDYKINLKAELEIRFLHEKIDLLLKKHWNRLMQIQQMQVDVLEEIKENRKKNIKMSIECRA